MSSQDSDGESFVSHYVANPKIYGDIDPYGWFEEEEQEANKKGTEDTSSDEDDAPLPQPGDMHVEFKKSSLPDKVKKSKIQFIPFRLLQENKNVLCEKIVELEQKISKLKEENYVLKRKLKDKSTTSSPPSAPKKET
jgi:hypothetical protein